MWKFNKELLKKKILQIYIEPRQNCAILLRIEVVYYESQNVNTMLQVLPAAETPMCCSP